MQTIINLLSNEILMILGSMLLALFCSLPGFVLSFFVDLKNKKHILFFIFASICAVFMSLKDENLSHLLPNIILNLLVIYFGLLLLKAIKNMLGKLGICKICDKLKQTFKRKE